jgi:uncharacterized Zn finger protein
MECPRCGQGTVLEVQIKAFSGTLYLCDECEALWMNKDAISPSEFVDFGTYMQQHGRSGSWSELSILGVVENNSSGPNPQEPDS